MRLRNVAPIFLLFSALLASSPAFSQDQRPWETPSSGFDSGTTGTPGSTGSHDKIETVINTSGGTRSDGTQISNTGTTDQQSFVNGFLNEAATKIKEAGGGTGWAWTWEKKWQVGPDGKPTQVKEKWVEGNIGVTSKPEAATPANTPADQPPSTPAATPAAPSSPAAASPGQTSPTSPTSPSSSSTSSKQSSQPSTATPATSAKAPPAATVSPKGIDIAPAKIPEPAVLLSIFDPISQQESRFAAAVTPTRPGRVPLVASVSRPIYEDTRVKIGLDLAPGIDINDMSVTIRDNEGDHAFERGSFPPNYRHIFRVPNEKDYTARVVYEHPVSKEHQEIINIQIPVLKMSFANRTVESSVARTSDPDLSTSAGSQGSSGGSTGWGARTDKPGRSTSSGDGNQTYDMSDLYTDPANPPEISGQRGGTPDESRSSTGRDGQGGTTSGSDQASSDQGRSSDSSVTSGGTPGSNSPDDVTGQSDMESQVQAPLSADGSSGDSETAPISDWSPGSELGLPVSGAGKATSQTPQEGTDLIMPALSEAATQMGQPYAPAPDDSGSTDAAAKNDVKLAAKPNGVKASSVQQESKKYLLSVSIRNRTTNEAQSFDSLTDPTPTAKAISPKTSLAISVDFAQNVQRDSVKVEIFDGRDRITTSPAEMTSGIVEHIFSIRTADAYVWVYGRTDEVPFSYKVTIPVTGR